MTTSLKVTCTFCAAETSTVVRSGVRYDKEAEVRRCDGCGLVFQAPMPSADELAAYYSGVYRSDYGDSPPADRYRSDIDEARARVHRMLDVLRPDASVVEIGAGSGAFLKAVEPYVARVVGVEPDSDSRSWAARELGVEVKADVAEAAATGPFDIISMFHVVEHLRDPVAYLSGLRGMLAPQGRLVVEVPNVDDALVSVYDIPAYREFYFQKAHLYYFSKKTLEAALAKAGFSSDVIGIQRYDLSNHLRWMLTGEPGGQGYYAELLGPAVAVAYAEALAQSGRSDTLWAVATAGGALRA